MSAQPLLRVRDLHTWFRTARGPVRAVDGVSLSLDRGRVLGVVGESGSGKTVLAKSLMGLLPVRNVERGGEVSFEGRDLVGLGNRELRALWGAEMAMIFQDPMTSLNPVMRIGAQITESLRVHLDMGRREAREAALALLERVKIPEPARRFREYPHQLSGGMRQRVTIAIAIACSPKLLFADEPTTALDVSVQAQILDLLDGLRSDRNMAMILVTHDLGVVAARTDEIAVMYAGQIVEHAPTAVLFGEMRMPYTEALLASVPRLSDPPHARRATIPGRPPDLVDPPSGCRFAPRCAYVRSRCVEEAPPLVASGIPGHRYACWYPVGSPEGKDSLARNLRDGHRPAVELAAREAARGADTGGGVSA